MLILATAFVQEELSNSWQKVGLMKEEEFVALRESQQEERVRTIEQGTECVSPPTPPLLLGGDTERHEGMTEECPKVQRRHSEGLDNEKLSKSLPESFSELERRTEQTETTNVPLSRQVSQPVNDTKDKARFYAVPPKAQMNSPDESRIDKVKLPLLAS